MSGTLFIVATPIGNLEDLSPRARQLLADVDLIAAEDTRHSGRLLSHFGIRKQQIALHEHNEADVVDKLARHLEAGASIALISDAGTPLISDPGYRLVRSAQQRGITVTPVPGASAVTAALSASGLPTDRFCFEGFLPPKGTARRSRLAALRKEPRTIVLFESVHRIAVCLEDLAGVFGADHEAFVGRELTKLHEQCVRAPLGELRSMLDDGSIPSRGEFVLVVAGSPDESTAALDIDGLLADLADRLPAREAAGIAARASGLRRNDLYERILALKK